MRPALAIAAFALSAPLCAQRVNLDEFLRLEPVLQAALQEAGPFVVTVETFGGTRRLMGKDGPMDGPAPPRPRPKPKPKKRDPDDEDGERKKPKLPLVAGGFKQAQGKTSGVVLTSDGWILISRFALNLDPTTVLVTVPGKGTYTAQRAGEDTSRGIALVKIDAEGLPVPTFVAPQDVRVGQWAFALGRTFAQSDPTVHLGIVSAKDRLYGRALQVDAYTSPANYGGAVVDIRGRVLGLAVPLSPSGRNAGVEWYDSGIGFAATIADIAPLLARMKDGQVLQRAWLGVQLSSSYLGPGAKVTGTPKDGAAAKAGVRRGDVIMKVDGVDVLNGPHFQMLVSSRLGGDACTLIVKHRRKDELREVGPVTLLNAPWSEQTKGEESLPASFSLPEGGGDKR